MHYSKQHNVLVYEHDAPQQVAAVIAGARTVNGSMVAIPANLKSVILARKLGMPAPPILDLMGYEWPIQPGRQPYEHQRAMANFMVVHGKCFNLSDMGTGKTLAMLWAADALMTAGLVRRALIISPLSTLRAVWDNEIFSAMVGRRTSVVLHGDRDERLRRMRRDADFLIINPDGLGIGTRRSKTGKPMELGPIATYIRDARDIGLVIVDECSVYKDGSTLRTRVLREVLKDKAFVFLASGTPTPNAPTDAHSLARLVGATTENFQSFKARTMTQITSFKWVPKRAAADIVRNTLVPAIRYSREECIDLPPVTMQTRDVELSETQRAAYDAFKRELRMTTASGQVIMAVHEASLRIKLLQIVAGMVYSGDGEAHKTDAAPRLNALKEVISEAGAKIIVFASFTSVVRFLASELSAELGAGSVAMIHGGVTQARRAEVFRAFQQDAEPRVIVADPGTMSHGLTLTAANTIVWYSPTDRNETYEQANARINRPGQVNRMLIVHLAAVAPEREIYRRLAEKQNMQGAILRLTEEGR